jgi:hypothetical protein
MPSSSAVTPPGNRPNTESYLSRCASVRFDEVVDRDHLDVRVVLMC